MKTWLVVSAFCLSTACGPGGKGASDGGNGGEDGGIEGATLEVTPGSSNVTVVNGAAAQQAFVATLHLADDSTRDVTANAIFTIDNPRLGVFAAETFTAVGVAGGEGIVRGVYQGVQGQATIIVNVENDRVVAPTSPDAPGWFDGASEDVGRAPTVVYPSDTTIAPPNLGDFEVHWNDNGTNDLFEVSMVSDYVDLRVYLTGTPDAGNWTSFLVDEWATAAESTRGGDLTITVRAMPSSSTIIAGTSTPITVRLTEQDVQGGIYYWASTTDNGAPAGIYRNDMARPGETAEQFYTTDESPSNRCVACHVLSRDGTKMAITYSGGNGEASIVDVASRTETLAIDGTFRWNFATFEPDGNRILTVYDGVMTLRDSATGAIVSTVPTAGYGTHPDFAPSGDKIVYVEVATPGQDWHFTGGSVVTATFDPATATFGAATTLVTGAENNYYPSWSPDGQWILFNKSTEDAYDDGTAELWVAKADGSMAPFKIDSPNVAAGLTNSWARWAPFEQKLGEGTEDQETFFWLTFSSKRAFGVRLAAGRPQIWMAPFFPARATGGMDPSAPAFRLPFQDISGNNHIAQWTEQVVPID